MRRPRFLLLSLLALLAAPLLAASPAAAATGDGYRLLALDGGVFAFDAVFAGAPASDPARCAPNTTDRALPAGTCFAITSTPTGNGYWVLDGDRGKVFPYGDAQFFGEPATAFVGAPRDLVPTGAAIVATPTGKGYWVLLVNLSGAATVAPFGDAKHYGDSQTILEATSVEFRGAPVALAATPTGKGYWEVHSDGGVFAFGDARYFGGLGRLTLRAPVVGVAPTVSGDGYWLTAGDGGVFAFGDAKYAGSMATVALRAPVVGIARDSDGSGYWLAASDGGVFAFGGAAFAGSMAKVPLRAPVVGIAPER